MNTRTSLSAGLVSAALTAGLLVLGTSPAEAAKPAWTKNCTALNKKYAHGLGKKAAKDKTSGTPVTTFTKSDAQFKVAMSHNKGLDRDKDSIACEKR